MLLGKRPRHQMKRTSSKTGIAVDVEPLEDGVLHIAAAPNTVAPLNYIPITTSSSNTAGSVRPYYLNQNYIATATLTSPRKNPHGANEFMETHQFLRICGLCQRHLVPGRDIYMYRGDTAFCSVECREELIKQEKRNLKQS